MVLRLSAAVGLVLTGVLTPSAFAAGYDAELVSRSPDATLESGEVLDEFVELRNTGTETWNDVTLGGPLMVQPVTAATTAPGAVGRFDFKVKAPAVTASTPVHAEFTPSSQAGAWTGAAATIDYTVLPSEPPRVSSITPQLSADGTQVTIGVVATDNVGVARVILIASGGGAQEVRPDADGRTYRATFPYAYCSGAGYRVIDRAGNETSAYATPSCAALPPQLVRGEVKSRFSASRRGTLARSLYVQGAPKTSHVELLCSGNGCAFKRRTLTVTRQITNLRPLLRHRRLRKGVVLQVRIVDAGAITAVTRYTVRDRRAPKVERLCQPPGAKAAGGCV
jgi:hypothetical protein